MSRLKKFHANLDPGEYCVRLSEADVEALRKRNVAQVLVDEWMNNGLCAYVQRTLWFVNPNDFEENTKEWFPNEASDMYVFARSAFGNLLFALAGGGVRSLHVHEGKYVDVGKSVGASVQDFLNYTLKPDYIKVALYGDLALRAAKTQGPVEADEMFTFEPALALGGAKELKYVRKVKMMPQLSILAQLHENVIELRG